MITFLFVIVVEKTSGAFKFRGACNAVSSLDVEQAAKGVITHSRFFFFFHIMKRLMLYILK